MYGPCLSSLAGIRLMWPPPKCATSPMCNGGAGLVEKFSIRLVSDHITQSCHGLKRQVDDPHSLLAQAGDRQARPDAI